ncbi:ubiquinone biosynthesis protein COQ9-A, mitochondrial-like isoform X2 [Anticarsia gemmatalis]|uniref:ubiquinone biosynthesis protein COQ9-A, mitochondrial-like isoform X2 n=1 Tax=Anticarsia gemmatalis TaxID=129554 RepID=UPI003F76EDE6
MGENIDIVDYISTLLDSGKYKEAISVPNEEKFANSFKDNCWDLISVVIGKIQDDTIVIKPSMYGACEQLLSVIIQKSSPEEALLEFIEQVELAKNDAQFGLVLPPLQDVLKKFSTKRGRSLEWCLNSISTYIENIPISEHHLEGQERLLMDSDSNVRRVTRVYTLLPPFYRYFINELDGSEASVKTKQIITAFLISLLALKNGQRILSSLATVSTNKTHGIIRCYSQGYVEREPKLATPVPTEHEEHQYEENVKNRILEKALEFVPKSGWSVESLSSGAKAAGYPTITHGLFPNGGADLVHYFNVKCNEHLVDQMKTWPKEDIKESKVPAKFVENAIMARLLMIDPYKSTWPKAMALQTLPNNVPNCLATLLSLVDDICYHSGDRSVDFNWYARRVGLAGIYKASELFYLTDSSPENSSTRSFVASRIRDAQLIQTALNLNPVSAAPQTLTAAFTTAKNILGMNTLK